MKIGKYRVDFNEMEIIAPESKALRRTNRPGLWLLVRMTENQKALHLKIHRIQTDNQIRDCQFPVILSPVVYKRSVGEQKLAKPFIEMSFIMRQFAGSNLRQVKYCKLLIQEFAIRIDMCFVNSLLAFTTLSEKKTGYVSARYGILMPAIYSFAVGTHANGTDIQKTDECALYALRYAHGTDYIITAYYTSINTMLELLL